MKIHEHLLPPEGPSSARVDSSQARNAKVPASPGDLRAEEIRVSLNSETSRSLLSENPDLALNRRQRVEALQKAVQNGSYQLNPDQIADAMISELLK